MDELWYRPGILPFDIWVIDSDTLIICTPALFQQAPSEVLVALLRCTRERTIECWNKAVMVRSQSVDVSAWQVTY
jgi:hypothetical protein